MNFQVSVVIPSVQSGQVYRITDNFNTEPLLVNVAGTVLYGNYTIGQVPIITVTHVDYPNCTTVLVVRINKRPIIDTTIRCEPMPTIITVIECQKSPVINTTIECQPNLMPVINTMIECRPNLMPIIETMIVCQLGLEPIIIATVECAATPVIETEVFCQPNLMPVIMPVVMCAAEPVIETTVVCQPNLMPVIMTMIACQPNLMPVINTTVQCAAEPVINTTVFCQPDLMPVIVPTVICQPNLMPVITPTVVCDIVNIVDINNIGVPDTNTSFVLLAKVLGSGNPQRGISKINKSGLAVNTRTSDAFALTNFGFTDGDKEWWDVKVFNGLGYATFSSDNNAVVRHLIEFNINTMTAIRTLTYNPGSNNPYYFFEMAFSPNLNRIYLGGTTRLGYFDLTTGAFTASFYIFIGGYNSSVGLDFVNRDNRFLAGSQALNTLLVIDNFESAVKAEQQLAVNTAGGTSQNRSVEYIPLYNVIMISQQSNNRVIFVDYDTLDTANPVFVYNTVNAANSSGATYDSFTDEVYYGTNNFNFHVYKLLISTFIAKTGTFRSTFNTGITINDIETRSNLEVFYTTNNDTMIRRQFVPNAVPASDTFGAIQNTFDLSPDLIAGGGPGGKIKKHRDASNNTFMYTTNTSGNDAMIVDGANATVVQANSSNKSNYMIDSVNNLMFAFVPGDNVNGIRAYLSYTAFASTTGRTNVTNGVAGFNAKQVYIFAGENLIRSCTKAFAPVNRNTITFPVGENLIDLDGYQLRDTTLQIDVFFAVRQGVNSIAVYTVNTNNTNGTMALIQTVNTTNFAGAAIVPSRLKVVGNILYAVTGNTYSKYFINPVSGMISFMSKGSAPTPANAIGLGVDSKYVYLASGTNIYVYNK